MADQTANVQKPSITGVAPTYVAANATDFFTATPNSRYEIHYKNGATATASGAFTVTDPTTPIPAGSGAVAGFADGIIKASGSMLANTELKAVIPNSSRFMDANGRINLVHGGTLTTVTMNILGPFPA
jgi:hypothetical protein